MMNNELGNRMTYSNGRHTSTVNHEDNDFRRLRHKNGELVNASQAFERSHVAVLHGSPYPVGWRRQGATEAWAQMLRETDLWREWGRPETSRREITQEILWQMEQNFPLFEQEESATRVRNGQQQIANEISANLLYYLHKGTVIEATPALEALLADSDVDVELPMNMVAPPYPAQYLYFGEAARNRLKVPNSSLADHVFDGVYCFFARRPNNPDRWNLELVFISKRNDRYTGQITLAGETDRGAPASASGWNGCLACLTAA